ncbi:hypothetical protein [Nesterenkonia jeotgali]|uniref:Uncharacterized protein n=2 Tax=Nesterenkonia jeotgali TaxID=317018 RepID=A0A0W8IG17_9MICC|nr:hypothetical protein [Nesterenkonia jeotgali]KUG58900.1 hypothetical protein AVL63_02400 [Nesterenkonia jeotgali]
MSGSQERRRSHPLRGARRRGQVRAAIILLGLVVLSSCAGGPDSLGGGSPGDEPTSAPAATSPDRADGWEDWSDGGGNDDPDGGMNAALVQPTRNLVSEHLSSWVDYTSPAPTQLQVAFYTGNPACYGVRAVVQEDAMEVRVATVSGTRSDAVNSACTQEARLVSLLLELEEPLGEREVQPLTEVELAP